MGARVYCHRGAISRTATSGLHSRTRARREMSRIIWLFLAALHAAAVVVRAAAGCDLFDTDMELCRQHPECASNGFGACEQPPAKCAERMHWRECVHGVHCEWDMDTGMCNSLNVSHAWFAECRARHPDVRTTPYAAMVACLNGGQTSRVTAEAARGLSQCQWDVGTGFCSPRYALMCPTVRTEGACDSTPGCVWDAGLRECYGLSATNVDCRPSRTAAACEQDPSCRWSARQLLCEPQGTNYQVSETYVDAGWRAACDVDFHRETRTPCVRSNPLCTAHCYWTHGCTVNQNPEAPQVCDMSPSMGVCRTGRTAAECGRLFPGGCVWNTSTSVCTYSEAFERLPVIVPAGKRRGSGAAWNLISVCLGLLTTGVLVCGCVLRDPISDAVGARLGRRSKQP